MAFRARFFTSTKRNPKRFTSFDAVLSLYTTWATS